MMNTVAAFGGLVNTFFPLLQKIKRFFGTPHMTRVEEDLRSRETAAQAEHACALFRILCDGYDFVRKIIFLEKLHGANAMSTVVISENGDAAHDSKVDSLMKQFFSDFDEQGFSAFADVKKCESLICRIEKYIIILTEAMKG